MDGNTIRLGAQKVGEALSRNSPSILTGIAVGGVITTAVLAVKATPKATQILWHEEDQRRIEWAEQTGEDQSAYPEDPVLTPWETVKLTWKCYVPAAVVGAATIACVIGANSINLRRTAALASAYSLAEATMREYQDKVIEQIGKNKEQKVHEAIAQDKLDHNPVDQKTVIATGKGSTLCFDALSGRYFTSTMEDIRRAENLFNQELLNHEHRKCLNDLYDLMGLEETELGRGVGWDTERLLHFVFSTKLASNNEPCLVVTTDYQPIPMSSY